MSKFIKIPGDPFKRNINVDLVEHWSLEVIDKDRLPGELTICMVSGKILKFRVTSSDMKIMDALLEPTSNELIVRELEKILGSMWDIYHLQPE